MVTLDDVHLELQEDAAERHLLLRASAKRFVNRPLQLKRVRSLRGQQPGYDKEVWRMFAELGWLGTLVPEEFGGLGLECADISVIAEELATALLPEPLTAAVVFAGGCLAYGDNVDLKSELLASLVQGNLIPAVAWREDAHECDPLDISTRADASHKGVKLYGIKRVVIAGISADGLIVTARAKDGLGLYWVPSAKIAGAITYKEMPDGRAMADVVFDGIEVPREHFVASAPVAEVSLMRAFDEALIVTSAELIGVCSAVLELTLDYLRTRVQFGKHIGSFQALQHRVVDLYIRQRICRHSLDEVLAITQQAGSAATKRSGQASRIKARCADASLLITREAVQMHGAMGYSDECDVGLYLKRAITLSSWLGGSDVHRKRYAKVALSLAVVT